MQPSDPVNPYQAPRAELETAAATTSLPASIENAVAGGYAFQIGEVMDEAWRLAKGMRGTFWGAAIVVGLIYLFVETVIAVIVGQLIEVPHRGVMKQVYQTSFRTITGALLTPLTMGLHMMCVRRALGQPISFGTAFSYFSVAGSAVAGALLSLLLSCLGAALFIIPGIYLTVAYQMTTRLIGDQNLSAWRAMEISRRAVGHQWFAVLGLNLAVGLLTALSALLLLIPLIWTLPWALMTTGVLYRRIFYASTPPTAPPGLPASP